MRKILPDIIAGILILPLLYVLVVILLSFPHV
jgi:hypothetical protein